MALIRCESFDHFTTQSHLTGKGWTASGTITLEAAAGRRGTSNLRLTGSNGCWARRGIGASSAHQTGIVGFALSTNNINTGFAYFQIQDGATVHLEFDLDASGRFQARRGSGGTILATGTTVLPLNTYRYVEVKFTIDDTTGSVEMRLDGAAAAELSFSGDTRNGGSASFDGVAFFGQTASASSPFPRIDDFYVCNGVDSTGTHGIANNTFLGDVRVDAFVPSTGNGTNTGLTPSAGVDHGAMVDDATPDDGATYNSGSSVGLKDTYHYPDLTFTPATIFGVQGLNRAEKTDAGTREICNVIRSGGTDYDGATTIVLQNGNYFYGAEMWESDPATSLPWEIADVNALEHGMKITA